MLLLLSLLPVGALGVMTCRLVVHIHRRMGRISQWNQAMPLRIPIGIHMLLVMLVVVMMLMMLAEANVLIRLGVLMLLLLLLLRR